MEEIINRAGIGALSGFFIAGAGFLKSYDEHGLHNPFDLVKFGKSIVLGGRVGGVAGGSGLQPNFIVSLPVYAGITVFVENLIKAIVRKARSL